MHPDEPHDGSLSGRLNWLRAGVLGANDGIISTAGLVIGVAGAHADSKALAIAGVAGLAAGSLSMAAGEYVSVSTQRDSEQAMLAREKRELREDPDGELAELTQLYVDRGLSPALAARVAEELTAKDALAAHAEVELQLDPDDLSSPWQAAFASLVSFAIGALLPLLMITLTGPSVRVPLTFVAVVAALALTGASSARIGRAPIPRAVARNVCGGAAAMAITYVVGLGFGTLA